MNKTATTIKNLIYTFRRETIIFFLLFLSLLCTIPAELHGWNSIWYAMDYSLGMDSRLLIGSFLKLFYPEFLPASTVYTFVFLSLIFFLLVISYILGYALRQTDCTNAGKGLLILIVFYLLCPGSPAYLWSTENMGRFDLYLLLFTLLAAVCFLKIASISLRLILFTLISLLALSIHQVFALIFFPLVFTMYLETMTEKKAGKHHIALGIIGIAVVITGFFYFQLLSQIHVSSVEELISLLSARTDLPVNEVALRYEYFSTIKQSAQDLMLNELGERIRYGCVTLLLLSPLAGCYGFLWFHIMKVMKYSGMRELFKYILILISQLCFVIAFVLAMDWGRWFGAFLTVQALQLIIMAAKKDAAVLSALTVLSAASRKHPYLFIICGIYLGSLQKFQATLLPAAPVFFSSVYRLLHIIF